MTVVVRQILGTFAGQQMGACLWVACAISSPLGGTVGCHRERESFLPCSPRLSTSLRREDVIISCDGNKQQNCAGYAVK